MYHKVSEDLDRYSYKNVYSGNELILHNFVEDLYKEYYVLYKNDENLWEPFLLDTQTEANELVASFEKVTHYDDAYFGMITYFPMFVANDKGEEGWTIIKRLYSL